MVLKKQLFKKETSFVVESWHPGPEKKIVDEQSCLTNSSDALRHLIASCDGNVLLREATNEELGEVQKFKEEFERTKIQSKIIYKNMTIQAQWNANIERQEFVIRVWDQFSKDRNKPGEYNYIKMSAREGTDYKNRYLEIQNDQKEQGFVIEGLPDDDTFVDCGRLRDLTIEVCTGPVRVRALTEDDQ